MDSDFYKQFENNFLGSRRQIMKSLSNYDGLIDYVLNIDNDPSLLDIGAGKAEWIQKCNAKGFKSIGIELDPKMVNDYRDLSLNIKEGEALSILDEFSDDSFSLVSAFHVIENMSYENIKEIIIQIKRILKPEGFLLLEISSIENILSPAKSLHVDPTNLTPINSDSLDLIMKRSGFKQLKYYFINSAPIEYSDHSKLTRVLNGVIQDLVIIATKSNMLDSSILDDSGLIKKDISLAKTTLEAAVDFDNSLMNRFDQYEESIFKLRKRIVDLEGQIKHLIYINDDKFSFINKVKNLKRKIVSINIFKKYFYKTLLAYLIKSKLFIFIMNSRLSIFITKRLYKNKHYFFFLRYMENNLDKLGVRFYFNKFVRKSKKQKEDLESFSKHNRNLETYFEKSDDAKNIFQDLQKYSQ